jgi:hypothetical protein
VKRYDKKPETVIAFSTITVGNGHFWRILGHQETPLPQLGQQMEKTMPFAMAINMQEKIPLTLKQYEEKPRA